MAELTISAEEITRALRRHVEEYSPQVGTEQIGRVVEVGDGIARVSGLPGAAVNELLEFEDGSLGLALNLDEDTIGAVVLGEVDALEEEQVVKATGRILSVPVGDALLGRVVNALGEPIDGKGPINTDAEPPHGGAGARHRGPPAGGGAAADRDQGHRRHDPHRPWPARADHRGPQDRQDHRCRRHHLQPAGPGREVHLRRHRPEELVGGPDGEHPGRPQRPGVHGRGGGLGRRPRPLQVPGPLLGLRHGPALDGERGGAPSSSTTTCPSRPRPTARSRSSSGGRRAARPTRATSSTSTAGCSSAPPSSPTRSVAGR